MKRDGYPAYAGIEPNIEIESLSDGGLPRIRGDRPIVIVTFKGSNQATPHTRGSTTNGTVILRSENGYPAYAGIDLLTQFV